MADPFRGGDKLAARLAEISQRLGSAKGLQVGFLDGATYPDGQSVASVAYMNEFGTRTAPARPFFRPAVAEHKAEWADALASLVKASDYDTEKALGQLGAVIVDDIKASIQAVSSPPLAKSTIAAKGSSKPLEDTGLMLNSVSFQVGGE